MYRAIDLSSRRRRKSTTATIQTICSGFGLDFKGAL